MLLVTGSRRKLCVVSHAEFLLIYTSSCMRRRRLGLSFVSSSFLFIVCVVSVLGNGVNTNFMSKINQCIPQLLRMYTQSYRFRRHCALQNMVRSADKFLDKAQCPPFFAGCHEAVFFCVSDYSSRYLENLNLENSFNKGLDRG